MKFTEGGVEINILSAKAAVLGTPNIELEAFSLKPFSPAQPAPGQQAPQAPNENIINKFKEYVDNRVQELYPIDPAKQEAIKRAIKQGIMHSIDKGELYLSEICLLGFLLQLKLQLWDPACRPLERTARVRGKDKTYELFGDQAAAEESFLGFNLTSTLSSSKYPDT
jgi:hypothetical protein